MFNLQDAFLVINSVVKGELHVKEEIIIDENEQFVDQVLYIVISLFIVTSIYCYNEQHCCIMAHP